LDPLTSSTVREPEARLVVAAARVYPGEAARKEIHGALRAGLDWDAVYGYASYNGVLPLVWKHVTACGLEHVPEEVQARFDRESRRIAFYNMSQALELVKVVQALEEEAIPVIAFKGPLLAHTAYGDTSYRSSIDLDLLVHRTDFERVVGVLEAHGYVSLHEEHTPAQRAEFIENLGGYDYGNYEREVAVELHWKFFPAFNAFAFDLDAIWQRHRRVRLVDTEVRALAPEDLLLYLCIHGTKHYWMKLKWLCDVAEHVRAHPALDWDAVRERADRMGVERIVRLSLLLVQETWGDPLPEAVERWAQGDRTAQRLVQQAAKAWDLTAPSTPEPSGMEAFWFHFRERERWRDRIPYTLHSLRLAVAPSEKDRTFVRLPKALDPLYLLVRPWRVVRDRQRNERALEAREEG
jgi:hypothetical protein